MEQRGELVSFRPDIKVVDCTIRDGGLVNNFEFEWEGDDVHFSFDVKGIEWDETFKITF